MGFAYLEKKKARAEYGWNRITKTRAARLFKYLQSEVKEMDAWLSGAVYGIRVTELESEKAESRWGFICPEWKDIEECVAEMLFGWVADDKRHELAGQLVA
jgi:hypothetical protein